MYTSDLFITNNLPELLSLEDTINLFKEVSNGSSEAREKLIIHNIRLVIYVVNRHFTSINYDKKDLVSIGNIGLIKAVDTFDFEKNFRFSTYATTCIYNEIAMFLRKLKKESKDRSLETPIHTDDEGGELVLKDTIEDGDDFTLDYEERETIKILKELIEQLPIEKRELIKLHYGFYNEVCTQKEIAAKLNKCQSAISKKFKKIINSLRDQIIEEQLLEINPYISNHRTRKLKK